MDLKFMPNGHYAVPIPSTEEDLVISEVEVLLMKLARQQKIQRRLLENCSNNLRIQKSEKILQLVKDSRKEDEEPFKCITDIKNECEVYKKYRNPKLRPAVRFSLAKEFNETASMDLKTYKGTRILHLIDYATRCSSA